MFKRPPRISSLLGFALFFSVILSLIAYPEIYLTFQTSFLRFEDYLLEYFNTSIIAGFMAQGNIQLWDHFGQMPFAYLFTTLGTFKFPNVITAVVFYLLSPMSDQTGVLFHHVFAWANLMTLMALRVVGLFLLLRRLIDDQKVLITATVLGAVFYSQPAFFIGTFYQSFYPIIFYLILCFLDRFQARYLAVAFCFFVISFANSLIHTCYLYMGVHFFILSALGWSLFCRREQWFGFLRRMKTDYRTYLKWAALIACFAAVVIGPYVLMQKTAVREVEFNVADSRLGKMFSMDYYFHGAPFDHADTSDLFRRMLDFTAKAGASFFAGPMIFMFIFAGAVLSRDSRKWIFIATILLVYLVNFPRDGINPGTPIHWLNALTNPFKSILRSYHMASHCVLAYLFIVLAAMGGQEITVLLKGRADVARWKMKIVLVLTAFFVITSLPFMPDVVKSYLGYSLGVISALFLAWILTGRCIAPKIVAVVLAGLLIGDIGLIVHQTKTMISKYYKRQPYETVALAAYGALGIDYHNPLINPVREFGAYYLVPEDALIGPLVGQPQNYFKHTNFMVNFIPIDGHNPRHKSYGSWVQDPEMNGYIRENHRMMFFADKAIKPSDGLLSRITQAGLSQRVIMVHDPSNELDLPDGLDAGMNLDAKEPVPVGTWSADLSDGKVLSQHDYKDLVMVALALPKGFPEFLSTAIYTEDRFMMRFMLGGTDGQWVECDPAQGELVKECSFDVNNVKGGTLTVAVSRQKFSKEMKFMLVYPQTHLDGLQTVIKNEFDHQVLAFNFKKDGWLVFQYPYDQQWRITVDGKQVSYYKANKSFIGFPVTQGGHTIDLSYAPGSWLRPWFLMSIVCSTIGLIVLLVVAFRWEKTYNDPAELRNEQVNA